MITRRGYQMATSLTKSHSPPRSASRSTYMAASSSTLDCSLRRFVPMNQPWVSMRYFVWSGSSICTSDRTRCFRPVMASTISCIPLGPRVGRGSLMKMLLVTFDYLDVVVSGDVPEGFEALRCQLT